MTHLPSPLPPSLRKLLLHHNIEPRAMPSVLPDTLEELILHQNFFDSLPCPLPSGLRRLDVSYVRLVS